MKRTTINSIRAIFITVGLTYFILGLQTLIIAQSITPNVLASTGSSDNVQLQWTVGELAVSTYDNGQNILTEGYHQTLLVLPTDPVGLNDAIGLQVSVYPNPTTDRLIISLPETEHGLSVTLHDMLGKLLLEKQMNKHGGVQELELTGISAATYLLTVSLRHNQTLATYKIQKTIDH